MKAAQAADQGDTEKDSPVTPPAEDPSTADRGDSEKEGRGDQA